MGIINCTPDSFYSKSRKTTESLIISEIEKQIQDGADIIDVGGLSSRPNKDTIISEKEEIERLYLALNVIKKHFPNIITSIDTFRANVAEVCINEYGASIVNDISGGQFDINMIDIIAKYKTPYILMHLQGDFNTMHNKTEYDNFMSDIISYFSSKIEVLKTRGIKDIIIDPGFGFSKSLDQNFELLKKIDYLRAFNLPILAGVSRKSMLYKTLNITAEECLNASTVAHTLALLNGASILRVHDVKEAKEAIVLVEKYKNV